MKYLAIVMLLCSSMFAANVEVVDFGSLPTCNNMKDGDVYSFTNGSFEVRATCDHSAGRWFALVDGKKFDFASLANWSEVDGTDPESVVVEGNGVVKITHPNDTAPNGDWKLLERGLPGGTYSLTVALAYSGQAGISTNHSYTGVGLGDTGTGFVVIRYNGNAGSFNHAVDRYSNSKTPVASYFSGLGGFSQIVSPALASATRLYYCVESDGINRTFSYSDDGVLWTAFDPQAIDLDLTPSKFVLGNNSDNTGLVTTWLLGDNLSDQAGKCGPVN